MGGNGSKGKIVDLFVQVVCFSFCMLFSSFSPPTTSHFFFGFFVVLSSLLLVLLLFPSELRLGLTGGATTLITPR